MDEKDKENSEGEGKEGATSDADEGVQPKADNLIQSAHAAAERTEKATAALKIENDRREEIAARERIAGKSTAGQPVGKEKDETASDYTKKVMEGDLNG